MLALLNVLTKKYSDTVCHSAGFQIPQNDDDSVDAEIKVSGPANVTAAGNSFCPSYAQDLRLTGRVRRETFLSVT